jgi:hypothetical protein
MPQVRYTADGLPYYDATDQQTQPYFAQPAGAMLPAPGNPAQPSEGWNQGVRDTLHGMTIGPVQDAAKALQGGMTDDEAQNFAFGAALGLLPMGGGLKPFRAYHGSPANISKFDRPAYFSPDRNYAAKFGNVHEVDISPQNPYYTNNEAFIESLRSFPERAAELRAKGHDAAILSGSDKAMEPLLLLGGYKQPQIYSLDPSIVSKVQQGIRAYHGSPHDFDRFDMSKIGTGEGAQAYGHGLYFADKEEVAKQYRDQLRWKGADYNDPHVIAQNSIDRLGDRAAAADSLESAMNSTNSFYRGKVPASQAEANAVTAQAIALLRSRDPIVGKPPTAGRMYEVNINAHPDQFLDWDKPLGQQSPFVRENLTPERLGLKPAGPLGERGWLGYVDEKNRLVGRAQTGKHPDNIFPDQELASSVYRGMGTWKPDEGAARMREAGIPGIKYLDQGSRTAGDGSRNYVVFDDKLISIIKKYGWAAVAPMLGLTAENLPIPKAQAPQFQ